MTSVFNAIVDFDSVVKIKYKILKLSDNIYKYHSSIQYLIRFNSSSTRRKVIPIFYSLSKEIVDKIEMHKSNQQWHVMPGNFVYIIKILIHFFSLCISIDAIRAKTNSFAIEMPAAEHGKN